MNTRLFAVSIGIAVCVGIYAWRDWRFHDMEWRTRKTRLTLEELHRSLMVFVDTKRRAPKGVEELIEFRKRPESYVAHEIAEYLDGWGHEFVLLNEGDRTGVCSKGEDGIQGTRDDKSLWYEVVRTE